MKILKLATAVLVASTLCAGEAEKIPLLHLSLPTAHRQLAKILKNDPAIHTSGTLTLLDFHDGHHNCDGAAEYSVVFDSEKRQALSVIWRPETPVSVSALFPSSKKFTHQDTTVLLREAGDDQVIYAVLAKPQVKDIAEATLMRRSAIGRFLPWLAEALSDQAPAAVAPPARSLR